MYLPKHATLFDVMDAEAPSTVHALVWTWLGLQIAGQVLLLLLLLTYLFSRRLKTQRHPIIINFVVTWLLSTFPALLLLYGGQEEGPEPNQILCLFNASLIAGVPPMEAVAFLAVMFQVWSTLRMTVEQRTAPVRAAWLNIVLIVSPYISFIAFSLVTGFIGFRYPESVTRAEEKMYCAVGHHNLGIAIWSFTIAVVTATFALQAWIVAILYRNWRSVRGAKITSEFDTHLMFRACAFTVYEIVIVASAVIAIFAEDSVPPKFMIASAPAAVFIILASQPDVLFSWFFCFRRSEPREPPPPPPEPTIREQPVTLIEALEDFTFPERTLPPQADRTRASFSRQTLERSQTATMDSMASTASYSSTHSASPLLSASRERFPSMDSLRVEMQYEQPGRPLRDAQPSPLARTRFPSIDSQRLSPMYEQPGRPLRDAPASPRGRFSSMDSQRLSPMYEQPGRPLRDAQPSPLTHARFQSIDSQRLSPMYEQPRAPPRLPASQHTRFGSMDSLQSSTMYEQPRVPPRPLRAAPTSPPLDDVQLSPTMRHVRTGQPMVTAPDAVSNSFTGSYLSGRDARSHSDMYRW